MEPLDFVGSAYTSRSKNFEASRLINLYPEMSESGQSKTVAMLIGTPGLRLIVEGAGGGVRGAITFSKTIAFVVMGPNVYYKDVAGTLSLIGTVVNRSTPVSMASNGTVVMFVTGPEGYVITPNLTNPALSVVTQITDPDFLGADRVDYMDGYFIFNQPGTAKFQITDLFSTSIDALEFATAEGAPDILISLVVDKRELWLFGETSTEVFFDSGNPDFPFERIQGAFINHGCAAKNSPCRFAESIAWLSTNEDGFGMVVKSNGYQVDRISTHAVELAIQSYGAIDDAIGFSYQQEGHVFYVLTFPTANATWVYDGRTELWHERAWRDPGSNDLRRHRANCKFVFGNKIIVGDWELPRLYELDLDTYTDNGDPLPAIRQVPHKASADNSYQFYSLFWVDMETGVGLNGTGQGSDPQVMLSWSGDGGHTFPVWTERWTSAGKIGKRRSRARWKRLGRDRTRCFRVTFTEPVKRIFIQAGVA